MSPSFVASRLRWVSESQLESQLTSNWNADAFRFIKVWPVFVDDVNDWILACAIISQFLWHLILHTHSAEHLKYHLWSFPRRPPFDFHLSPALIHVLTLCIRASVGLYTVWTFVSDGNDPLILTRGLFCCSVTFNHRLHFTLRWMNEWMNEWPTFPFNVTAFLPSVTTEPNTSASLIFLLKAFLLFSIIYSTLT